MQFAINLLDCGGIAELIVLGTSTITISALSATTQEAEGPSPIINPFAESSHALAKQACWSIALVMILACLFSTLDNVVTLSNAHGTIAVQTWPRLFWLQAALPPVLSLILPSAATWDLSCSASPCSRPFPSWPWRPAPIPTWALSSFT